MELSNIQIPNMILQTQGSMSMPTILPSTNGEAFSELLKALMGNLEQIEESEVEEVLEKLEAENDDLDIDKELPYPVAVAFNLMNLQEHSSLAKPEMLEQVEGETPLEVEAQAERPIFNLTEEVEEIEVDLAKGEAQISFEENLNLQGKELEGEIIESLTLEDKPKLDEQVEKVEKEVELERPESFEVEVFNLQAESKEVPKIEPELIEKPSEAALARENIQRLQDSIIEHIETRSFDNKSVMELKLHPEELGTLDLTLEMEEGKLLAKITVENDYVKELFTDKLGELNQNLIKQNINIVDLKVEVRAEASLDFNFNGSFNQEHRQYSRGQRIFRHENTSTEEISLEMMNTPGKLSILA